FLIYVGEGILRVGWTSERPSPSESLQPSDFHLGEHAPAFVVWPSRGDLFESLPLISGANTRAAHLLSLPLWPLCAFAGAAAVWLWRCDCSRARDCCLKCGYELV